MSAFFKKKCSSTHLAVHEEGAVAVNVHHGPQRPPVLAVVRRCRAQGCARGWRRGVYYEWARMCACVCARVCVVAGQCCGRRPARRGRQRLELRPPTGGPRLVLNQASFPSERNRHGTRAWPAACVRCAAGAQLEPKTLTKSCGTKNSFTTSHCGTRSHTTEPALAQTQLTRGQTKAHGPQAAAGDPLPRLVLGVVLQVQRTQHAQHFGHSMHSA